MNLIGAAARAFDMRPYNTFVPLDLTNKIRVDKLTRHKWKPGYIHTSRRYFWDTPEVLEYGLWEIVCEELERR